MLIATPYRDFDVRDRRPPKVISEVRKTYLNSSGANNSNPKLTAELLVKCMPDKNWYFRRCQVRNGQLYMFSLTGNPRMAPFRLPLRHLSLQAGPLSYSFSLCRGQNIILTVKVNDEYSFNKWVNILAIELIRQTPLDAIKYLDILTLAECWSRTDVEESACAKDIHFNNVTNDAVDGLCGSCNQNNIEKHSIHHHPSHWNHNNNNNNNNYTTKNIIHSIKNHQIGNCYKSDSTNSDNNFKDPEILIESLLKRCQNVETYVPVKEKLFLFESLCKMDRKVRSSEDVSFKCETSITKRAKSCQDLTNLNAVRQICKYFETKNDDNSFENGKYSYIRSN